MATRAAQPALNRQLGIVDATLIGVGSMVGAGVFVAWSPAAAAAGSALLIALVVAAFIAYCNATASAQLAAVYPRAGGTYVYAGERLGRAWGFVAGWAFVAGKTASCAVMAQAFARYTVPGPRPLRDGLALAAVAGVTCLNYRGITRTALATRILLAGTVAVLLVFAGAIWSAHLPDTHSDATRISAHGLLQAAAILFFAFAGYARIATLGEEVRDPSRSIPRAIQAALAIALAVYLLVALTLLHAVSPADLGRTVSPLRVALDAAGHPQLHWVLALGVALGSLGALLALMAGIGRTTLAMAREGDLPRVLAAVHPRFAVPHRAELVLGVAVAALVLTLHLPAALGLSNFCVLVYYAL
ncbi:MAG: APC family permease, partial [Pseudonocardiales bacterium]